MAHPVERPIADRAVQVPVEAHPGIQPVAAAPQLQQDLLGDILGLPPRAEDVFRRGDQAGVPGTEELLEGGLIAGTEALEQGAVGGRVGHGTGSRESVEGCEG